MTGYLSVGSDGLLSEYTELAIAHKFARIGSGGSGEPLPDYAAGATSEHAWLAPVYNPGSWCLPVIRGLIASARNGATDREIVIAGDSVVEGYNAGSPRYRRGWVGVLRAMLGAVEGTIFAFPTGIDSRWTTTNLKAGNSALLGLVPDTPGAWEATFVYDTPHTGGTIRVHSAVATTVTVVVDGGAVQSFPVAPGNGVRTITPTVTGDGPHTYKIASPAADHLLSFRPTYSGPRLKVTNAGRSGATASYWRPGYSATGTGLWDALTASTVPDVIICALGINQPSEDGPANAANLTALWATIAALGKPALIMTPGGLDLTGPESWLEQYVAQFNAADVHDLPLIDNASMLGTRTKPYTETLMADATHPNALGHTVIAAGVHDLIN